MNKLKFMLILFCVFVLTGCDATYNLTIDENSMVESVDFMIENTNDNKSILKEYMSSEYMAYYDMDNRETYNYTKKELSDENNIGLNLSYSYVNDELQKSSLLNRCYYKKSVIKDDGYIIITTDGNNACFYQDGVKQLDKLTVNIRTKLNVTENNADKVKDGVYTWVIDESNFQNHPINIKIELPEEKEKRSNVLIVVIIAILFVIVIGGLFALYVFRKNKRNNKL